MTKDAVHQTLRAQPFKPFALRLTDGSTISVPHQDFISISPGGRTVIVFQGEEKFSIVDVGLLTAFEFNSNGR